MALSLEMRSLRAASAIMGALLLNQVRQGSTDSAGPEVLQLSQGGGVESSRLYS